MRSYQRKRKRDVRRGETDRKSSCHLRQQKSTTPPASLRRFLSSPPSPREKAGKALSTTTKHIPTVFAKPRQPTPTTQDYPYNPSNCISPTCTLPLNCLLLLAALLPQSLTSPHPSRPPILAYILDKPIPPINTYHSSPLLPCRAPSRSKAARATLPPRESSSFSTSSRFITLLLLPSTLCLLAPP